MSRDGNRRRMLTPDERVLWSLVTKTIAPLHDLAPLSHNDGAAPEAPALDPVVKSTGPGTIRTTPALPQRTLAPPPLAPLGRRMRTRVARGKEAIDARLDLHGMTQAQAHSALLHFLRNAQTRGARLVLVITGKGARGEGERGVLRRQVPQWLGLPDFRGFIVGFEDAHIAHGGEGALYVRVRRAYGE
jgi:DNA-nicking Smr family endonuclease